MFFHWVADKVWYPGIPTNKHCKKYVFGVFLNRKRIALVREKLAIDIILESGARGRNLTTDTRIFKPLKRTHIMS